MARVKLDLSIPDRGKFNDALAEAKRHGLAVSRSFADLGLASGSIETRAIGTLLQIDGIASVAPRRCAPCETPRPTADIVRLASKKMGQ